MAYLSRPTRIKNKNPAPIQITAEQILREAMELRESDSTTRPPKQSINDAAELAEYQLRRRKEFEDRTRRARSNVGSWVKYAQWEESQKDFARARSVWERALEVDPRSHSLWLKYAEATMKAGFVNRARNVWDRAVTLLPRVDQLWYKYVHMEEMLGNVAAARQLFERWMEWKPDRQAWISYVNFELRYNEVERARAVFERLVQCHPAAEAWIRFAKFEAKNGEVSRARSVYERAAEALADEEEEVDELYLAFAEFEEWHKEPERARAIYEFALAHVPQERAGDLYSKFAAFERRFGDGERIDSAIARKRKFRHEEEELRKKKCCT